MEDHARTTSAAAGASRFELAPPRRFVLPAILLLLTEQPGYGYSLEKDLREFRFGPIDRPTVYRTLAQLEADGLVESWSEAPTAGQARRMYGVTPLGERALRVWMSVIKEERDCLGRVLRRYQATGTVDAVLAEVEGGWAAALGFGWSPVATTAPAPRRLAPVDADRRSATPAPPPRPAEPGAANEQRAPLPPGPGSFGGDGRGALDGRPDQLRRPRRDRMGRGGTGGRCDPSRHPTCRATGDRGRRSALGKQRVRRRVVASHQCQALPELSRSTSATAWRAGPRTATGWRASSRSTARHDPSTAPSMSRSRPNGGSSSPVNRSSTSETSTSPRRRC